MELAVRPLAATDRDWVRQFMLEHWGADSMIAHGERYYPHELPGFIAMHAGDAVGLVTYRVEGHECEIITIDSTRPKHGVGTALIEAAVSAAEHAGCCRIWLLTTNDNLNALRFYQRRGFELVAIHRRAIEEYRKLKPQISLIGEFGIPLRDAIELEMQLRT
jgi:ribosomal protein S18 acetylase RimI-like enzyme